MVKGRPAPPPFGKKNFLVTITEIDDGRGQVGGTDTERVQLIRYCL
jgi:hypothetical protein